jgi:hypothetical protein
MWNLMVALEVDSGEPAVIFYAVHSGRLCNGYNYVYRAPCESRYMKLQSWHLKKCLPNFTGVRIRDGICSIHSFWNRSRFRFGSVYDFLKSVGFGSVRFLILSVRFKSSKTRTDLITGEKQHSTHVIVYKFILYFITNQFSASGVPFRYRKQFFDHSSMSSPYRSIERCVLITNITLVFKIHRIIREIWSTLCKP